MHIEELIGVWRNWLARPDVTSGRPLNEANNEMTGSVYILQSEKNGAFYIGSSENPILRVLEHNSGKTIATKNKGPWELVFNYTYPNILIAKRIEYKLKRMKSRKIIEKIIRDGYIKTKVNGV